MTRSGGRPVSNCIARPAWEQPRTRIRAEHVEFAREPVGQDPGEEEQQDQSQRLCGHHEADAARAIPFLKNREGHRHRRHGVAADGCRIADEEEKEVALTEDAEPELEMTVRFRAPARTKDRLRSVSGLRGPWYRCGHWSLLTWLAHEIQSKHCLCGETIVRRPSP